MLAELFGTKDEPKEEPKKTEEITASQTKSDWLDLKSEAKPTIPETTSNKTVSWQTPAETSRTFISDTIKKDDFGDNLFTTQGDDVFKASQAPISRISETTDRRKSESSAPHDSKKSKQRFKSLDLDLDFDFDKPSDAITSEDRNILESKERKMESSSVPVPEFEKGGIKTADEDTKRNVNQETSNWIVQF